MKDSHKNLIIGGSAGIVSRTLTAPLELYKIQSMNKYMPNSTLRDVIKKEGIRYLWKGNFTNCVRVFPQMAINYSFYSYFNKNIPVIFGKDKINDTLNHLISGACAGAIAMASIYPFDNIRGRLSLQTNKQHYDGIFDAFRKTPLRELYGGIRLSVMGFAPYNALSYTFYNKYKTEFSKLDIAKEYPSFVHLMSGGMSAVSAITLTFPTELVRRRLQLQGFDPNVPKYNGIVDAIKKIVKSEGICGLYRGLRACYIKLFPTFALQFWTIEQLKKTFEVK